MGGGEAWEVDNQMTWQSSVPQTSPETSVSEEAKQYEVSSAGGSTKHSLYQGCEKEGSGDQGETG